jgi:LysR family transcriptional regulator, hydrogen peroxide-inducible genes activator
MQIGMEVHELRYFLALAATLNFTRAAGPLIHRERGNTHLTELGRIMRPHFEQVLAGMEQAKATAKLYNSGRTSTLTLGIMCTIGPARTIEFFSMFHRENADIQLYIQDAPAAVLEEKLETGDLNVAIYCKPQPLSDKFHLLPLYQERFVIAVAPSHPFASRGHVAFKDLQGQHYLNRANCEYNDTIDTILDDLGVEPVYHVESERDDWIQSLVMAGLGCTAIPEFAATIPGLVLLPLVEPEITRCIQLVSVRGRPHTAPLGAMVVAAKQYAWPGVHRVR